MHEEGKRGTFFYSDVRIHPNEQKKCPSLSLFHIRNDKPNSVAKYRSFPRITKLSSLAYGYFSCKYKIFMYRKLAIYGPIVKKLK